MKVKVNDKEIFELSETQKRVIMNDIPSDEFEDDMCRRLKYILEHKYEQCAKRLKSEWEPKLRAAGVASIPLDPEAFAEAVFARPEYEDRKAREDKSSAIGSLPLERL